MVGLVWNVRYGRFGSGRVEWLSRFGLVGLVQWVWGGLGLVWYGRFGLVWYGRFGLVG